MPFLGYWTVSQQVRLRFSVRGLMTAHFFIERGKTLKRNFLKTLVGFMVAILGTCFLSKGLFFVGELIYIGITSESILNLGYYYRIGMIHCDVAFYISVSFIICGIWLIGKGARIAAVIINLRKNKTGIIK